MFKYKPAAIARAENNGIFIAQNLKPIPYRVYAVQDKNDNQMYEPGGRPGGFPRRDLQPCRDARFRHVVRLDPPVRDRRAAALFPHVHRQGVPPPGAFADRAAVAAQGDALLRRGASEDHPAPFRQHSGRPGDRRSADRGPRYDRPVVQRPLVVASRYDQGRDHLFQTRHRQPVAGGHRAAEARLASDRDQGAGARTRETRTRTPQGRGRGRGVGGTQEGEPLRLQDAHFGRDQPREPPDGRFRLSAREARFGRTAADARARG